MIQTQKTNITMRKKSLYLAPESEVIELKTEGTLLEGSDFGTSSAEVLEAIEASEFFEI